MNELFINKKIWNEFSPELREEYVDNVYNYYNDTGFPYFPTDSNYRRAEMEKLLRYDDSNLIKDGVIRQTMHGLGLAWSFHPHAWDIECAGKKSPKWAFENKLREVIVKRMRMGDNMSDNGLRKMLKMYTGVQSVSNFRPTAASAIYKRYGNEKSKVLDMSGGFGGRMLGAIKAGIKDYTAIEPSSLTVEGLRNIRSEFWKLNYIIHKRGSELYSPAYRDDWYDIAFTSPPYFNQEVYADEPTQSCVRFTQYEDWLENYLGMTIVRTIKSLKSGGFLIINIANVSSAPTLVEDFEMLMSGFGHEVVPVEILKLALSNSNFTSGKSAYKYEPVFVYKKM